MLHVRHFVVRLAFRSIRKHICAKRKEIASCNHKFLDTTLRIGILIHRSTYRVEQNEMLLFLSNFLEKKHRFAPRAIGNEKREYITLL